MNVAKLFLRDTDVVTVTHVRSASLRVTRSARQITHNVERLSAALRRRGVGAGDRVLILCSSRIEAVESILATMVLGAVAVPASPLLGHAVLEGILARQHPVCCIVEDVPGADLENALLDQNAHLILLHPSASLASERYLRYATLLDEGAVSCPPEDCGDEHPALVIHSSGSVGHPKAITLTHGSLLRFFEYHSYIYSQYSDDAGSLEGTHPIVTALPLSHLAGLGTCLQGLLSLRHSYLLSHFLPDLYLRLIEEARCSFITLVPSFYRSLLEEPSLATSRFPWLKFCITAGEPCPQDLAERIATAFGARVVSAYSMTECMSGIGHSRRELFGGKITAGSCGKQLFGELRLVDAEGQEAPNFGELWVRNTTVHPCYSDDSLNAERFVDGWFRTRDLFFRDANGELFHRGRADDMFHCNGKNIYPSEIEGVLLRHPAVQAACAAQAVHPRKGAIPAALVIPRAPVSASELQAFSLQHGPSHTVPQLIVFADTLPLLAAGKRDKQEISRRIQRACDALT